MLKKVLTACLVLLLAFSVLTVIPENTQARVRTIGDDNYLSKEIVFTEGEKLHISLEVDVIDGPNVDIYVMDEMNFNDFKYDNPYNYISKLSREGTSYWQAEGNISQHDTYYFVIDNTDRGEASPPWHVDRSVTVDYQFEEDIWYDSDNDGHYDRNDAYPDDPDRWEESSGISEFIGSTLCWVLFVILVVGTVLFVLFLVIQKQKGGPPAQPSAGKYGQGEQSSGEGTTSGKEDDW